MAIEDIIVDLSDIMDDKSWDSEFIIDLGKKIREDSSFSLTTKQAEYAEKILKRHKDKFDDFRISRMIDDPVYRNPLRETKSFKNEVRATGKTCLSFRFKYNKKLITTISEEFKDSFINYSSSYKIWTIGVNCLNVHKVSDFIGNNGFEFNDEVLEVLARGMETKPSSFSLVDGEIYTSNPNLLTSIVMSKTVPSLNTRARMVCCMADMMNSPVDETIVKLSKENTVRDRDLGPYADMLNTASESAVQYCLDNPTTCLLINPKSYDALSAALCDAYLSDRNGSVIIIADAIDDETIQYYQTAIKTRQPESTIYIDSANKPIVEADFIITTSSLFMLNDMGKIPIKSVIVDIKNAYGMAISPMYNVHLYENDRIIFIENMENTSWGEFSGIAANLSMTASYNSVSQYMKDNISRFDKLNLASMLSNKSVHYSCVDIHRLLGVYYPKVKDVSFFSEKRNHRMNTHSETNTDDSIRILAEEYVSGSDSQRKIINDRFADDGQNIAIKSRIVSFIIGFAKTEKYRPIIRTKNEKLAIRLKSDIIVPELYKDDQVSNTAIARFLYPDSLHRKYSSDKRVFKSNGLLVVDSFVDNLDILRHCNMMIYCEPFTSRQEFELEYQFCKLFNIRMVMACIDNSYEEYITKLGWYK